MKQLRKFMASLAGGVLLVLAGVAQANVVTLSDAQLDAFTLGGGTNTNLMFSRVLTPAPNGNQVVTLFYSACFDDPAAGTCQAVFQLTGQSIAFGGSDTFAIDVYNSNGSPWEYTLTIVDVLDNQLTTSTIIAGEQQTMSIASNGTVNPIQTILMSIRDGPVNLGNHDAMANFNMASYSGPDPGASVPEPGALLLLGLGLGLLSFARRRSASKAAFIPSHRFLRAGRVQHEAGFVHLNKPTGSSVLPVAPEDSRSGKPIPAIGQRSPSPHWLPQF